MTIDGIFFIDSGKIRLDNNGICLMSHFVLSMLAAVWGRTRPVYTRLEAVRKMMSTVVGLVLVEAGPRSRWRVVRFARLPITAITPAATPPTSNWSPLSMMLRLWSGISKSSFVFGNNLVCDRLSPE